MPPLTDCDALPGEYAGTVNEIPQLADRVDEISIDDDRWIRLLRCRHCGQLWEERHASTGHGEIATTRKMNLMAPYDVLSEISRESQRLRFTRGKRSMLEGDALRSWLWQNTGPLAESLRSTVSALIPGPYLERVAIYVDDPLYRQGTAAVVLDFRFDVADPFTVAASCGIDHGFILLHVARAPIDSRFEQARERVEHAARGGVEVQLRDIRI